MQRVLIVTLFIGLASCTTSAPPRGAGAMSDYYHWRGVESATGWIVFLPGSSGLTVLKDDQHYFEAAERLNMHGWNVLLVDYKPAYRAAMDAPNAATGEKIAWVTEQAIEWMKRSRPEMAAHPGAIVAWSLGAEGAIAIANDRSRLASMGIRSIAMYYPSSRDKIQLNNQVPMLVLTGELDDVTPAIDVKALVQNRNSNAKNVELHTYPNAHHGFDVASIKEMKTLRLLLLVGPKATLQYNAEAATDAEGRLTEFLSKSIGAK